MNKIELMIKNGSKVYVPVLTGEVKWSTERQGAPGKLTFHVVKDGVIDFQEGNQVSLYVGDKPVFLGYVFEKKRNKDNIISVLAYDQLRYLKNKDSFTFENKKASEFILSLAQQFQLKVGEISDTGYVIPTGIFDGKTLFDMIQATLDETIIYNKKIFVLYDDFGKLMLKAADQMKLDVFINNQVLEDFNYISSIDSNTYNKIRLEYEDKKTKKRVPYEASDASNIEKWGVLQYYEKSNDINMSALKANDLLQIYNKKTRRLSLSKVFGDIRVRGGSGVAVSLNLGDIEVNQYFLCESVCHTFRDGIHVMDITLKGSDFYE